MERLVDYGTVLAIANQNLVLLPERAVWWPDQRTLFIADPHFGKAATFRAAAIPIPDGTEGDLRRLDLLLEQTAACKLIILGDLLHARQGRCPTTFETVRLWRERHPDLHIQLIIGNHDRRAGLPPADWRFECVPEPVTFGPFQLRHHPQPNDQAALAGHLHPKFRLETRNDKFVSPGFLLRRQTLILPAFGSLIDHLTIKPEDNDQCFLIVDSEVCRI